MAQRVVQPRMAWLREARAAPEFAGFMATVAPLLARSPRGDGHRVLVLPGFRASDTSTRPIRWFLDRLGYRTHGWGLGTNGGPTSHATDGMRQLVDRLIETDQAPISLVGWSLGGVYAHGIAERVPDHIRQVITLGSPLNYAPLLPVKVPATSIYSKSDTVVPHRASMLGSGPLRENIEVRGSHIGLGHNPPVLVVVADRLAQPADDWQPYRVPRWARAWLPS
ncbi:MAG: esterase/lipase family protein [Ilumatobacteraceae bacterium]